MLIMFKPLQSNKFNKFGSKYLPNDGGSGVLLRPLRDPLELPPAAPPEELFDVSALETGVPGFSDWYKFKNNRDIIFL